MDLAKLTGLDVIRMLEEAASETEAQEKRARDREADIESLAGKTIEAGNPYGLGQIDRLCAAAKTIAETSEDPDERDLFAAVAKAYRDLRRG